MSKLHIGLLLAALQLTGVVVPKDQLQGREETLNGAAVLT